MFDRFTDRARAVMGASRQEAIRMGNDHIGPEHMLLGLASVDVGVGATVLTTLGVDLATLQDAVDSRARWRGGQ